MSARRVKKSVFFPRLILIIILLALIIFGTIYAKNNLFTNSSSSNSSNDKVGVEQKEEVREEPKEEVTSASFIMVGDNLIHSSIYNYAHRLANYDGYDFKPIVSYIKEKVQNYDVGFYNQETILGGSKLGLSDYPQFNSPHEVGDAMIDAGFDVVTLATNHTLDRGSDAVLSSRKYWDSQEGVLAVGSYDSFESQENIPVAEINGITYAVLNYTYGTNGIPVPEGEEYLVNLWPTDLSINDPSIDTEYQAYKEQVAEDIDKIRDKVDLLIVAMHWGVEYTHAPTEYQLDAAEFLSEHNVDVIIGSHPHVIQPVAWVNDTLVFYSLGNFVSAQYQDENYNKMIGLMSSFTVTKTTKGEESSIKIDNIENDLLYTYYNQANWSDFKVVPFSHKDIGKYLPSYESVYKTYKQIVQNIDEDMYVVPLAK